MGFVGCSEEFETPDIALEDKLTILNDKLKSSDCSSIAIPLEIENNSFFIELEELKNSQALVENKVYATEDSLTKETQIFFQNFFNQLNNELSFILVAQYFIEHMQELELEEKSNKQIMTRLTFLCDLALYFQFNFESQASEVFSVKYIPCPGRSCFDCCMYNKLDDVFNRGNIVDQIAFLASPAGNTLWYAASCVWDC
ncbi:MAG: hypothetical protein ACK5IJ_12200 [Mangrovibacterium sp.]